MPFNVLGFVLEPLQKAIDKYKKSIKYFGGKAQRGYLELQLHKCLAFSYQALGQYKEALIEFDKAATQRHDDSGIIAGRSEALLKLIEKQEKDFQEKLEGFLEGPDAILALEEKFTEKEEEYKILYDQANEQVATHLQTTLLFILIIPGLILLGFSVLNSLLRLEAFFENSLSMLPYLSIIILCAAVPAWKTRIYLRSRDRWQILREDCFRKAAIMKYIRAAGRNEEFRNQIILETIRHLANRGGADLLAGLHTDDHGMSYSIPDTMEWLGESAHIS